MSIKPKFTLQSKIPSAQRYFTDRTDPRKVFTNNLDSFISNKHSLINYYGMGGIGKSRLIKELNKELLNYSDWSAANIDMSQVSFHDCATALLELRNQLRNKLPKIQFTSFDFAYATYWQRLNPGIELSQKGLAHLQNSDLINDVAKEVFVGMEAIPGLNVVPKIGMIASKTYSAINKWWLKRGSEQHANLQNLSINEMTNWLPAYFCTDIEDFFEKFPSERLCIFFDTYEALWDKSNKEGQFFQEDEWIREFVSHLPQVLFVIAGREKLRWEEIDSDWNQVVDSHILTRLSDEDSELFLDRCDIKNELIKKTIIESSEGSPFYLDLAVDNYIKIKSNGTSPQEKDFTGKTHREILDRFIKYLDRNESATLIILSLCRQYDFELFSAVVKHFDTGYSAIHMKDINRYSFIQEISNNSFAINPIMKRALNDNNELGINQKIFKFFFNFYRNKIEDFFKEGASGFKNFIEAKYYASMLKLAPQEKLDFTIMSGKLYQYQCQMDLALIEFEKALSIDHAGLKEILEARIEIATTQRQHGNIECAEITLLNIFNDCKRDIFQDIEGKALIQKGLCLLSKAKTTGQSKLFEEAHELYKKGLSLAESTKDTKQITYAKIAISTVLEELGEVQQAIDILIECKGDAKRHEMEHTYIDCLNGLARKYLITNEYEKCIEYSKEGLELWRKSNFYRGQLVMCCHLLNAYFALGQEFDQVDIYIKEGDKLNEVVTEHLIKHMYKDSRDLWLA
jgi:tetratricopeptide (TPR) repeat protein